jgi:hypothetical protein
MGHTAQQDVTAALTSTKAAWAALVIDDDAGVRQSPDLGPLTAARLLSSPCVVSFPDRSATEGRLLRVTVMGAVGWKIGYCGASKSGRR